MRVFSFLVIALLLMPVHAAPQGLGDQDGCKIAYIDLQDQFMQVHRKLRQVIARADSYELRIFELSEEDQANIPRRPEKPEIVLPPVDCGDFDESYQRAVAGLEAAITDVSSFELDVATWDEAIAAAEGSASAGAPGGTDSIAVAPDDDSVGGAGGADTVAVAPDDDAVGGAGQRQPLSDPDNPNLFRRVISLPGAQLSKRLGESVDSASVLPTFSVLYVFEEQNTPDGEEWILVGPSLREDSLGWVNKTRTLDWSIMLVMQFAPRGSRRDVVFFDEAATLQDIVRSPFHKQEVVAIYDRLLSEREKLRADDNYQPQWDNSLIAIEPQTAVTFQNEPYLLPILEHADATFDDGTDAVLLRVAAVPAHDADLSSHDFDSFQVDLDDRAAQDDEFRTGVVFVLDTTVSMQPFIERTYQTIEYFYSAFESMETSGYIDFGLVGYRDNITFNPSGLEYVTHVFQPLDTQADSRQVLVNMRRMTAATAPTVDFREDGFAGISTAISAMDWTPYNTRVIILVTDASSREGPDSLAAVGNLSPETVAEVLRQSNIALVPVHLLTPANQRSQDAMIAASQYRTLAQRTGNPEKKKYIALDASSEVKFAEEMEEFAKKIVFANLTINSGRPLGDELQLDTDGSSPTLADAVIGEMFRGQLESLATVGDGDAPSFLSGWAADLDLVKPNPNFPSLVVSVFLTRNQLSTLSKRLKHIVDAFRTGGDNPQTFFDNLQKLATEISTDPDLNQGGDRAAIEAILPSFLRILPYHSEVLRLNRDYWSSLSVASRQEYIEKIEAKLKLYEETYGNTSLWKNFGGDPGGAATPIRLSVLP